MIIALRTASTSNLYTYMTTKSIPSDWPATFVRALEKDSFKMLSSARVDPEVSLYYTSIAYFKPTNQTNLFKLDPTAYDKLWWMNLLNVLSAFKNIRRETMVALKSVNFIILDLQFYRPV